FTFFFTLHTLWNFCFTSSLKFPSYVSCCSWQK
ncbi:hypothetical protein GYH30_005423, partial [Glycine max]